MTLPVNTPLWELEATNMLQYLTVTDTGPFVQTLVALMIL